MVTFIHWWMRNHLPSLLLTQLLVAGMAKLGCCSKSMISSIIVPMTNFRWHAFVLDEKYNNSHDQSHLRDDVRNCGSSADKCFWSICAVLSNFSAEHRRASHWTNQFCPSMNNRIGLDTYPRCAYCCYLYKKRKPVEFFAFFFRMDLLFGYFPCSCASLVSQIPSIALTNISANTATLFCCRHGGGCRYGERKRLQSELPASHSSPVVLLIVSKLS